MKIVITGYSGSGKSTLAKALGEYYNIPVLHLDNAHFYGDWQDRSREEMTKIVSDFMNSNDSWVIDGNYYRYCVERFDQANLYIFFNYNRFKCFRRCKNRYKANKGKHRYSCPCDEKFDSEFKKWILFEGRTRKRRKLHKDFFNKATCEKYMFKNEKQYSKWLINKKVEIEKYL